MFTDVQANFYVEHILGFMLTSLLAFTNILMLKLKTRKKNMEAADFYSGTFRLCAVISNDFGCCDFKMELVK